jgi:hypothetical protein
MIRCPKCGRVSHHPKDEEHRYCGACHQFHDTMNIPSKEEIENTPWDHAGFIIAPGRYYDRMYFIYLLPEIIKPFGGDHNGLIWRFENNPNEWYYTYRNRYYAGPNTDPHGGEDTKHWTVAKSATVENLRRIAGTIATAAGEFFNTVKPDETVIVIEGDSDKFGKVIMEGNYPFMHMKSISIPTS